MVTADGLLMDNNDEPLKLAVDEHRWASRVRELDQDLSNNKKGYRARQVSTILDASAGAWRATTNTHERIAFATGL